MYGFRVAHNTISGIIRDVCKAYAGNVVNTPAEPEQWKVIAEKFGESLKTLKKIYCLGVVRFMCVTACSKLTVCIRKNMKKPVFCPQDLLFIMIPVTTLLP